MRSRINISRICAPVALAALAALVPSCGAYASASQSGLKGAPLATSLAPPQMPSANVSPLLAKELAVLTDRGISSARAWQAIDVQDKVAGSDLSDRLQAAMGGAFAGTWFEPAAGQLHVGATSPASRLTAERIILQAGLAGEVIVTPVRSTMGQLLAAQQRWNRELAPLFGREEVETALEPQYNAVSITLSAAVSTAQRAALRREAAAEHVHLILTAAKGRQLGFSPEAKECNNFTGGNANCKPSITAGVQIWSQNKCSKVTKGTGSEFFASEAECLEEKAVGKEGEWKREEPEEIKEETGEGEGDGSCTAGPAAIPLTHRKLRVLLTAGHCIDGGGGTNVQWLAYDRESNELLIGKAGAYADGGAAGAKKGDYGEIAIEPPPGGGWQTGKINRPVLAVTAEWKKAAETRYRVKGERPPEVGNMNCHEGKASGEWCGEIKALNVTASYRTRITRLTTKEGLVEDEKAISETGDSGGPWLFIETNNEARMEGTHAGKRPIACRPLPKEETGPLIFFSQEECLDVKDFKEGDQGRWEREAFTWFEPLKKAVGATAQGSLEALDLELLTTGNERIAPEIGASGFPVKFTTSSGESKLETTGGRLVKCKASKGEGEVSSATEFKNTVVKFTGCKGKLPTFGEGSCKSTGAAAEEIVTNKVRDLPVYLNKSKTEVGLLGEPQEAGALYAEFKCENLLTETVKVKGTTLAALTPVNSSTKLFTLLTKQEKGKPTPSLYENAEGEKVKAKAETKGEGVEAFGYEESAQEASNTLTAAEALEVEA